MLESFLGKTSKQKWRCGSLAISGLTKKYLSFSSIRNLLLLRLSAVIRHARPRIQKQQKVAPKGIFSSVQFIIKCWRTAFWPLCKGGKLNSPPVPRSLNTVSLPDTRLLLEGGKGGGRGFSHTSRWIFLLNHTSRNILLTNRASRKKE